MINKKMMQKAAEYIKKHTTAEDWSFRINSTEALRTRFAQNGITQHITGDGEGVSLTVAFEGKTGSASINNTSEESLDYLINTAETIARRNQPDPEYIAPVGPQELCDPDNYASATAGLKPEDMVNIVNKCVDNAQKKNAKVSGMTEKDVVSVAMFTSKGFSGFYDFTSFAHSMTIKKGGAETKISRSMLDYNDFDIDEIIDQLNRQFHSLAEPQPIKAEKIPVILRPPAVVELFIFMLWMLDRRGSDEGVWPFTGQMNKKFFGDNFSARSSINEKGLMAPPFVGEGLATDNIDWIKNGVIKNMVCSRYYAQKIGAQPVNPYNLIIEGGKTEETEMMKMVKRGVILNNLWYIRFIDRKEGSLTGLTRDGVMYFEDGKIVKSVNNFRWNEVMHDVTRRILALGPSQLIEKQFKVPTMLVNDFNFVDTTSF